MQGVELRLFYSSSSSTTLSKTLSLSLSKRSLPHHISRFSSTNQQQQQPPKQNQNQDEEESDGEDIDVAALEEEARNAAREYSTSLSRQLTIGESFDFELNFHFHSISVVFNQVIWFQRTSPMFRSNAVESRASVKLPL